MVDRDEGSEKMALERRLREAVGLCQALLQRYHDGERTADSKAKMVAEVELIIGWLIELNLPSGATEKEILGPVETFLFHRYGHEVGQRLNREFTEIFEGLGLTLIRKSA